MKNLGPQSGRFRVTKMNRIKANPIQKILSCSQLFLKSTLNVVIISAGVDGGRGAIVGEMFQGSSYGSIMFSGNNVSPVLCSIITLSINFSM